MRQNAKVCSAMQQMKNAIGWNAMKLLKMHQNAIVCTGMRMGKNYTTFGKKLHYSHLYEDVAADAIAAGLRVHRIHLPPDSVLWDDLRSAAQLGVGHTSDQL